MQRDGRDDGPSPGPSGGRERYRRARMSVFTDIPEVSAATWRQGDADAASHDLVSICHNVGFFTLVDHGIDPSFLDAYFASLRAFFALPRETKQQIAKVHSPHFRGWEDIGSEQIGRAHV